ncbi:hypothetical protein [Parapedobacter tibetensis]|uniref:hypothetical protein n=1 Tax=Parapedobacter tibetensis TaxID=2972951 RepID=UPI00214DCB06|nr:hypothetical protein [Parapedobacter tibetensis]
MNKTTWRRETTASGKSITGFGQSITVKWGYVTKMAGRKTSGFQRAEDSYVVPTYMV